ncbi:hypothetical protein GCM10017744_100340 [Streptomyces antimycoticus]|uniref:Uncharacterized protein n=1 Tax=Streptomyces antimycoticus TaxID=68175 RepID=A0A4D4JX73_9ACTN|nr:hypothetical protein SANT12839_012740 [Streptomyces antimycoticus]
MVWPIPSASATPASDWTDLIRPTPAPFADSTVPRSTEETRPSCISMLIFAKRRARGSGQRCEGEAKMSRRGAEELFQHAHHVRVTDHRPLGQLSVRVRHR